MRLKDKIALVTGSAAGIGLAAAKLFAAEGAHVYITDVDGEGAAKAAAEVIAQGHSATAVTVDVSRGQDVTALMRLIEQQHRRLDVVVNNAGINVRSDFRNLSDADWVRLREVNLDGIVRIARDAFPLMKASGRASLVNLASIMGHRASSGPTPVRNRRNIAMGIFTRLKNGGPTLIFDPRTASESTGKSVPARTATQATRRIRLLNRKLDSRESMESS